MEFQENIVLFIIKLILFTFVTMPIVYFLYKNKETFYKSRLCINLVRIVITKKSLKIIRNSNLILYLLGEYLDNYNYNLSNEVEREVKKYKYLIKNGINETIHCIEVAANLSNKTDIKILKNVLRENKKKLDRVDFSKIAKVINKELYVFDKHSYYNKKVDCKYNKDNYFKYFSKTPVMPKEVLFGDFHELKMEDLNEIIEVVDNPEEEFPLYIDPYYTLINYHKTI